MLSLISVVWSLVLPPGHTSVCPFSPIAHVCRTLKPIFQSNQMVGPHFTDENDLETQRIIVMIIAAVYGALSRGHIFACIIYTLQNLDIPI